MLTDEDIVSLKRLLDTEGCNPEDVRKWFMFRLFPHSSPNWHAEKPSDKQLGYIRKLGYKGNLPETKKEASDLIDKLVKAKSDCTNA